MFSVFYKSCFKSQGLEKLLMIPNIYDNLFNAQYKALNGSCAVTNVSQSSANVRTVCCFNKVKRVIHSKKCIHPTNAL